MSYTDKIIIPDSDTSQEITYQILQRCVANAIPNAIVLSIKTKVALIQDIDDRIISAPNGSVSVKKKVENIYIDIFFLFSC